MAVHGARLSALLALAGALTSTAATQLLRIAGSSTVFPVAAHWGAAMNASYSFADHSGINEVCPPNNSTLCGGGSSTGARRVCAQRSSRSHVDIGDMSREWKASEAVLLDDGYTYECTASKVRVTQMIVGVDGIAVVVGKGGVAHRCILALGGLTLAQLRWMFSNWDDETLQHDRDGGVDVASVAPNNDHNGVKEWRDLSAECERSPINPYGAGNQSGTSAFFGEVAMCTTCFAGAAGHRPEFFNFCAEAAQDELGALTAAEDIERYIQAKRAPNCYIASEDDEQIHEWVVLDPSGIAYFGYAYYSENAADLAVIRIASDVHKGVRDTTDALILPSRYSITDGSYQVFRRSLYMNVDNEAWGLAKAYMAYGYSDEGMQHVADVGYVVVNAALRAKMKQRLEQGGNPTADYVSVAPSTCPIGRELIATPYLNRFGTQKVNYTCAACQPGYAKRDNASAACAICGEGSFTAAAGQSQCTFCLPGASALEGALACTPCPINEVAPMPGQGKCSPCGPGLFTPGPGAMLCDRCPQGTYRTANETACTACPAGMTTAFRAATLRADCMCASGTYHAPGGRRDGPCLPCPEGMRCPFGSEYDNFANWSRGSDLAIPELLPDHWSGAREPLSVYSCRATLGECPGGGPESCNGGRVGRACAVCPDGQTLEDGACAVCGGGFSSMPALLVLGVSAMIVAAYYTCNAPLTSNVSVSSALTMAISMALTVAQLLAMFRDLNVHWHSDAEGLFGALSLTLASPSTLKYECVIGQTALLKYFFRCLVPAALLADVAVLFFASKLVTCARPAFEAWTMDKAVNTASQVLQAVFIGLAAIMVVPLQCYRHPNGESSLAQFPEVLCWRGGDHTYLVLFGLAVGTLFVLPFVAFCVWGTVVVVRPQVSSLGAGKLVRYRFLLFRFRPDVWWWGNVMMVRQLLLVFAPSLPSETPHAQSIYVIGVLSFYGLAQAHYWPWKAPEFNLLDLFFTTMLAMIVVTSTAFLDLPKRQGAYVTLIVLLITVLFCGSSFLVTAVLYHAARRRSPSASFGVDTENHEAIARQFFALCLAVRGLGSENCQATLDDMSYYDRCALVASLASYQACNPAACPASGRLVKARLAGVPRSDSMSSAGSLAPRWRDAAEPAKAAAPMPEERCCRECGHQEGEAEVPATLAANLLLV